MNKTLIVLVLAVIVLGWKFVFSPGEKLEFTDQTKVLQGLSTAIAYKIAIRKYWIEKKALPSAEEWKKQTNKPLPDLNKSIVGKIKVGEDGPGVISVYYAKKPGFTIPPDVIGKKIMLIPEGQGERINWKCSGTVPAEYLPKKCSPLTSSN